MCLPWLTGSVVMQHFTADVHGGTKLLTLGSESKKKESRNPPEGHTPLTPNLPLGCILDTTGYSVSSVFSE